MDEEQTRTSPRAGSGDARLCHALHCVNSVWFFERTLKSVALQLLPLDHLANHDDIVDDALLAALSDWRLDHISSALCHAVADCRTSLSYMKNSLWRVQGLFKGELRDETEETLARTVKVLEARCAKLEQVKDSYELPGRPHEIRRNAFAYLLVEATRVTEELNGLVAASRTNHVSEDFTRELQSCAEAFLTLQRRFETLRERCSQKMERNLDDCVKQLESIQERLNILKNAAGQRAGALRLYRDSH